MHPERAQRWLAVVMAVVIASGSVLQPLAALAQAPTAEQMTILQGLSKEQRDAILQQMDSGASRPSAGSASENNQIVVQQPGAGLGANAGPTAAPAVEPRIAGGEQLLVKLNLRVAAEVDDVKRTQIDALRNRILERNPYELTRMGVLQLPGFEPIALAGLTGKEVQERLAIEPALRDFWVAVTLLRVEPRGVKALKPFGYEMFRDAATAFVPGTDIPVPDDYKLGPGDTMSVQLYGQTTQVYTLPVGRNGEVSFPQLGPIKVAGLGFASARNMLESRVKKQMIGTEARVTLRDLRSARVLVLGDAEKPGSYVLSGLATTTTALFASGGVKPIGSLRRIEVKRGGALIRRLDLYEELLQGNTGNDVRLQTDDAVFIPPVGPTTGIDGQVRRPAIYELLKEKTVGELVALAGGLTPEADLKAATIERIEPSKDRTVRSLDLNTSEGLSYLIKAGDLLRIPAVLEIVENGIQIEGYVHRPGTFAFRQGLRISDVLASADELKPGGDLHYLLVRREDPVTRRLSVFSADLEAALAHRGAAADLELRPRDSIFVFDLLSKRDAVVEPLLRELRRQSRPDTPAESVAVSGSVHASGSFPLEPGMRVSDLLRAAGGLEDAAYAVSAELTRYAVVDGSRRQAALREVNLDAVLKGDAEANITLEPYDLLMIKTMPEWGRVEEVQLVGEVRFPGPYRIRRGEYLSSVLRRAGGLTPLAFPSAAVFTREQLKAREQEQIDRLTHRLEGDLSTLSLQQSRSGPGFNSSDPVAAGQGLLAQLRATKPVGRLVINLAKVAAATPGGDSDILLHGGDRLIIPRQTQEVLVFGEVQNPTSHLYRDGLMRDEAIGLSGGFSARADKKRTYVVRADGSVAPAEAGWHASGNITLHPGDSVVVPLDAEKMQPLPMWTAITTIIYNLAIAATAIRRL